jgi:hypothetical protein
MASCFGMEVPGRENREHFMEELDFHDITGLTLYAIGAGIIEGSVRSVVVWSRTAGIKQPNPALKHGFDAA